MAISSQLGSNTSAEVATNPEIEAINEILRKREGRKFIPFDEIDEFPIDVDANFHFHPDTSGFSSKDISNYDETRMDALVPKYKKAADFLPTEGYRKGLFFPLFQKRFIGRSLSGLGYISITGAANRSNEYQGVLLSRMPAPEQVKLFEKCGFDVSHAVLPVRGGKPRFDIAR